MKIIIIIKAKTITKRKMQRKKKIINYLIRLDIERDGIKTTTTTYRYTNKKEYRQKSVDIEKESNKKKKNRIGQKSMFVRNIQHKFLIIAKEKYQQQQ